MSPIFSLKNHSTLIHRRKRNGRKGVRERESCEEWKMTYDRCESLEGSIRNEQKRGERERVWKALSWHHASFTVLYTQTSDRAFHSILPVAKILQKMYAVYSSPGRSLQKYDPICLVRLHYCNRIQYTAKGWGTSPSFGFLQGLAPRSFPFRTFCSFPFF